MQAQGGNEFDLQTAVQLTSERRVRKMVFWVGSWSVLTALGLFLTGVGLSNLGSLPGNIAIVAGTLMAWGGASRAIWIYRALAHPPTRLRADVQGVTVYSPTGVATGVGWRVIQSDCSLVDRTGSSQTADGDFSELVPQNESTSALQYVLLRRPVLPTTFLTPEAFRGVLQVAELAGVRLTLARST